MIYHRRETTAEHTRCLLNFPAASHPSQTTGQQRTGPVGGAGPRFQADIATRKPHASTKHYLMCACQKAAFDHSCFSRKVFSLRGFRRLSLQLASQYNYQKLQAAALPGIQRFSQGSYYFPAELFGSQTKHLNNLVYEARD